MKKYLITNDEKQVVIKDREEVLIVDDRTDASDLEIIIGEHCRVQYLWLLSSASEETISRQVSIGDGSKLEAWQIYNSASGVNLAIENNHGERGNFENHVLFHQGGASKLSV